MSGKKFHRLTYPITKPVSVFNVFRNFLLGKVQNQYSTLAFLSLLDDLEPTREYFIVNFVFLLGSIFLSYPNSATISSTSLNSTQGIPKISAVDHQDFFWNPGFLSIIIFTWKNSCSSSPFLDLTHCVWDKICMYGQTKFLNFIWRKLFSLISQILWIQSASCQSEITANLLCVISSGTAIFLHIINKICIVIVISLAFSGLYYLIVQFIFSLLLPEKSLIVPSAIYQLSAVYQCPDVFLPFRCSDKYISEIFLLNTQIIASLTYTVSKFSLLMWYLYGLFHANSHRERIIRSYSDNLIYYTLPYFNFFAIENCYPYWNFKLVFS